MKTSELQGAQLDYWVARAEGFRQIGTGRTWVRGNEIAEDWAPSVDWAQGGPLIDKYGLDLSLDEGNRAWYAMSGNLSHSAAGVSPLQAICRAVVRAAFGDEVPEI